jgi:hypothetical protein
VAASHRFTLTVKRKHYAPSLHVTIMLIYFTLRPKAYFRVRLLAPTGMEIYGMGTNAPGVD